MVSEGLVKFLAGTPYVEWSFDQEKQKGSIKNVPIFELGKHKGETFDLAWANGAISTFVAAKTERGYLPTIILGHTPDNEITERPAIGFLDNLRLEGERLVADFVDVISEAFESIKKGMYPYRSVEIMGRTLSNSYISACALLGGNAPAVKFPPLLFGATEGEWVSFDDSSETKEEPVMPEPEVATVPKADYDALAAQLEAVTKLADAQRVTTLTESLRLLKLTPAVIESPEMKALVAFCAKEKSVIKFNDTDTDVASVLVKFTEMVIESAQKSNLLIPEPVTTLPVEPVEPESSDEATAEQITKYGEGISKLDADVLDEIVKLQTADPKMTLDVATTHARNHIIFAKKGE